MLPTHFVEAANFPVAWKEKDLQEYIADKLRDRGHRVQLEVRANGGRADIVCDWQGGAIIEVKKYQVLEAFSAANGWQFETIQDLGSGLNYQKKGLQKLLKRIMQGDVARLVLTHKDRLLRFGAELVFAMCEEFETEVVIINKTSEEVPFEQELVQDMIELITVFSARLYGSRSRKNKKLIDGMTAAVKEMS